MSDAPELLPCPCCGAQPDIYTDRNTSTVIKCRDCGLNSWSYKSDRVIEKWNARIPHLPAELVERIRHKLEWLGHERNMFDMIEPQPEKWVALVADILAALEQKP